MPMFGLRARTTDRCERVTSQLRVAGVLVAVGKPVLRLLNKALRATRSATAAHGSSYPTHVAVYPAGDPQLRTSDERLTALVHTLTTVKARWAATTSAERAKLARACASRVRAVRKSPRRHTPRAPRRRVGGPAPPRRRHSLWGGRGGEVCVQVAESMASRDGEHKGNYETGRGEYLLSYFVISSYLQDLAVTLDAVARGHQRRPAHVRCWDRKHSSRVLMGCQGEVVSGPLTPREVVRAGAANRFRGGRRRRVRSRLWWACCPPICITR